MIEINPSLLLAQVITFLLAAFLIWKIAWGPLTDGLRNRRERIKKDLDLIELTKQAVKKLEGEYETRLQQIQQKADEMLKEAKLQADQHKEAIITIAQSEAQKIREKALEQLKEEQSRLLEELRQEVSFLSLAIAEKLLRQSVDKTIQDKIFQETLQEIDKNFKL